MLRPVTTRTIGPEAPSAPGSAASAAAAPRLRRGRPPARNAPSPARSRARRRAPCDPRSRAAARRRAGIATRTASPSAKVAMPIARDGSAGAPRHLHDRERPAPRRRRRAFRRALAEQAADAADQRAVADGDDHGGGRLRALVEDLPRDRAVAVPLHRLVAVLEEGKAARRGEVPRRVLGAVEIRAGLADRRSLRRDERRPSRATAPSRNEDRRVEPETRGRPRRRGAVIARRGRDDAARPARAVCLERRERAAPLEGAERVRVLSLQEDGAGPRRSIPGPSREASADPRRKL